MGLIRGSIWKFVSQLICFAPMAQITKFNCYPEAYLERFLTLKIFFFLISVRDFDSEKGQGTKGGLLTVSSKTSSCSPLLTNFLFHFNLLTPQYPSFCQVCIWYRELNCTLVLHLFPFYTFSSFWTAFIRLFP